MILILFSSRLVSSHSRQVQGSALRLDNDTHVRLVAMGLQTAAGSQRLRPPPIASEKSSMHIFQLCTVEYPFLSFLSGSH